MNYDEMLHCIVHGFAKGIKWHDFSEVGGDEPYYEWYYAQDRLYVIRDRIMNNYRFIKAGSPLEAMQVIHDEAAAIAVEW